MEKIMNKYRITYPNNKEVRDKIFRTRKIFERWHYMRFLFDSASLLSRAMNLNQSSIQILLGLLLF